MRIAVMVLGLVLGAVMFFQTVLVAGLSGVGGDEATNTASAGGILMALVWLVACALVLALPLVSTVLFVLAGAMGFGFSADFPDLAAWGGVSLALAVLSFFGWIGKRRGARRERIKEVAREAEQRAATDRAVAAGIAAATGSREGGNA